AREKELEDAKDEKRRLMDSLRTTSTAAVVAARQVVSMQHASPGKPSQGSLPNPFPLLGSGGGVGGLGISSKPMPRAMNAAAMSGAKALPQGIPQGVPPGSAAVPIQRSVVGGASPGGASGGGGGTSGAIRASVSTDSSTLNVVHNGHAPSPARIAVGGSSGSGGGDSGASKGSSAVA
ncbi:unnamed protein product, partial [Laminaria digitata]